MKKKEGKKEVKEKIGNYKITSEGVSATVDILKDPKEYVPTYRVTYPRIERATHAVLDSIRERIVAELAFKTEEILNPEEVSEMKEKFIKNASTLLGKELPHLSEKENKILIGILTQEALGLGPIEFMLKDQGLEEIVINTSKEPIWVYHRKFGWLKTNVNVFDEAKIYNYAAQIGRKVGTQITNLNPLMDAYLTTGDRANATLFPISSKGNTLTIRKFARRAWTITDFIEMGTLSADVAAFLWLAIQYEMNIVCTGGTASGKTSFLNVLSMFIPPTQRIISIEDSVTGDTEIIVKMGGEVKIKKIENLVKDVAGEAEGKIEPRGIEVLVLDNNLKIRFVKPKTLFKHRVKKDLYEILTSTGKGIKVTQDHSLFTLGENGLTEVKPCELSEGDFIATPRIIPYQGKKLEFINLMEHLPVFNGFVLGEPIRKFLHTTKLKHLKSYGVSKSNLQHWKRRGLIPTRILHDLIRDKKMEFSRENLKKIKLKLRNSFQEYPLFFKINDDLLQLFGLWLGDGSYDYRNENKVIISNSDKECIDLTKRVAKKLGANIYEMGDGVSLSLNSTFLYRLMRFILGFEGYSKTKRVPHFAFNLSNSQVAKLLKGYFSADGCVKTNEISCTSQSLNLLRDIQTLLLRFGLIARINDYERADECKEMNISAVGNVKLFEKNISFLQKRKAEKIHILVNKKPTHTNSDVVPIRNELGIHLKRVKPISSWYFNNWNLGRPHLQHVMNSLGDDWEWYPVFYNLANSDIFWDKIAKIRKVKMEDYVYDISTPPFENFLANNFIVHNTREIQLPPFLHWVPMTTRPSNIEGKGEVTMLQLMINALRMRPDRMIVGEIRRSKEAEVLFEAINTGHSVYSTLHANTSEETFKRLVNPPINIPTSLLTSLQLIAVMHRDRRKGIRRLLEVTELIPSGGLEEMKIELNTIFKWIPSKDQITEWGKPHRLLKDIKLYSAMSDEEIRENLEGKKNILLWLVKNKIRDIEKVGRVISDYYKNPESVLKMVRK